MKNNNILSLIVLGALPIFFLTNPVHIGSIFETINTQQSIFEILFWISAIIFVLFLIAFLSDVRNAKKLLSDTKDEYISLDNFQRIVDTLPKKFDEIIYRLDPVTKALLVCEGFDVAKCETFRYNGVIKMLSEICYRYDVLVSKDDWPVWRIAPNVLLFPFELIDHQYPYSKSQIEEIENKANNDELRRIAFSSRKLKIFYNEISCDDPKKDKARLGIIEVISDFEESLRNLHRINSK
jgi:hypothetical protein